MINQMILVFLFFVISDIYLFQEIVLLNPCFLFSKNHVHDHVSISYLKCTSVASLAGLDGLAATGDVLDMFDLIHSFQYENHALYTDN